MGKFLNVGLTGAIACGKSLALSIFKAMGCPVMDADQIYHELVQPGEKLLQKLVKEFGEEILQEDGSLNRDALRKIITEKPAARGKLNRIAHPAVIKEQNRRRKEIKKDLKSKDIDQAVIITDAALMIESGNYKNFDKVVVIACRPENQLQRLMAREAITEEEAKARMALQMTSKEKEAYADYIVDNNGTSEELIRNVEQVLSHLFEDVQKK
jgi:dephospho-CoA kinase